ncbi:MAG TPA: hypothetical protein PKB15_08260 [Acidimicrobiia bacterium]|nr:hypothetical protein [Acidimicrobiia bacterium]
MVSGMKNSEFLRSFLSFIRGYAHICGRLAIDPGSITSDNSSTNGSRELGEVLNKDGNVKMTDVLVRDRDNSDPYSYGGDPHVSEQPANIPEGMFQSQSIECPDPEDKRARRLYDWAVGRRSEITEERKAEGRNGTDVFTDGFESVGKPSPESHILEEFYDYLINKCDIVNYLVTHVIPEIADMNNPDLLEQIRELLNDPKTWPNGHYVSISVSEQTRGDDETAFTEQGPDSAFPKHVDASALGTVRIADSDEVSSIRHDGWFFNVNNPVPVTIENSGRDIPTNGDSMSTTLQADPGKWYAWSESKGVHERPFIGKAKLEEVGGKRCLPVVSINFSGLVHQAEQNLGINNRVASPSIDDSFSL